MRPGRILIGDWAIPHPVSVRYNKKNIHILCCAFNNGSDPRDEIKELYGVLQSAVSHNPVMPKGDIVISNDRKTFLEFNDGNKKYYGYISDINWGEDSDSERYILYTIVFELISEPTFPMPLFAFPTGDEVIVDDDWEKGYETYDPNNPGGDTTNPERVECKTNLIWSYKETFVSGREYSNLDVYSRNSIFGVPSTTYGYLKPPAERHKLYQLNWNVTNVFKLAQPVTHCLVCADFGFSVNTVTTGRYGERIEKPMVPQPAKRFDINGKAFYINQMWKKNQLFLHEFPATDIVAIKTYSMDILLNQVVCGIKTGGSFLPVVEGSELITGILYGSGGTSTPADTVKNTPPNVYLYG